jgi:hypothetical protein
LKLQGYGYANSAWTTSASASININSINSWTSSDTSTEVIIQCTPSGSTSMTAAGVAIFANAGCQILGSNTNTAVTAGYQGELMDSVVLVAGEVSLTSTQAANITSITLTAGNWLIMGEVWVIPATSGVTLVNANINTSSGTAPTVPGLGTAVSIVAGISTTALQTVTVGPCYASLSGNQTYYLNTTVTFGSTCHAYGKIFAVRQP